MRHEDNPKSIKYHVKRYIARHPETFRGKVVLDMPAGNGVTARLLQAAGAEVHAFDLFPEFFDVPGLTCQRADIQEGIPLPDASVDVLICQEGIEHFSDQYRAFREFNRLLRPGGTLIVTTPNYSNLRAKLSYLLGESERYNMLAPNELDSVWMADQSKTREIYFGHIFLLGIQKLRTLGKVNGFDIDHIPFVRTKPTSTLLLPFWYPFIWLTNWLNLRRQLRRNSRHAPAAKAATYREIYRLAINPKILVDGHLFVVYRKRAEWPAVAAELRGKLLVFGET